MHRLTPFCITVRLSAGPRLRPLSTSAFRSHKETLSNNPEFEVDKIKQASLERQKQGKGEWMSDLASDSEETVKADRAWDTPPSHRGTDAGKASPPTSAGPKAGKT